MQRLICVIGRTCSGKDTFVKKLCEEFPSLFKPVTSFTTRPMRENESDGVEHFFVNKKEFDQLKTNGRPIAYTKIGDYEYMALYEDLVDSNLYIIDPIGLEDLRKNNPDLNPFVIYLHCPDIVRRERAMKRKDGMEKYDERCASEDKMFKEFEEKHLYNLSINTNAFISSSTNELTIGGFLTCQ